MNKEILEELIELEEINIKLSTEYEEKQSYEMAFIAIWSILERIMKSIASVEIRKRLRLNIDDWVKYLNDPEKVEKPDEIRNFATEYTSHAIPHISLIEAAIGDVPELKELMNTKGKYRKKRNDIAHRADKMSKAVYSDYKMAACAAIDELKRILSK
ncbi:MAG: hypothetical protein DU489_08680 [Nitrosomonas sp.]|uniref:hypothetical protein n=1 Tax=Nitrosomonas sp. TaxID=42353 RepID=UPI0032EE4F5D